MVKTGVTLRLSVMSHSSSSELALPSSETEPTQPAIGGRVLNVGLGVVSVTERKPDQLEL